MGWYVWNPAVERDHGAAVCPHCLNPLRDGDKFLLLTVEPFLVAHAVCQWARADRQEHE